MNAGFNSSYTGFGEREGVHDLKHRWIDRNGSGYYYRVIVILIVSFQRPMVVFAQLFIFSSQHAVELKFVEGFCAVPLIYW